MGQPVADRQGEGMNVSPRKNYILFNASVPLLNTYPGADIIPTQRHLYTLYEKKSYHKASYSILHKTEHVKYLRVFR